jgi:GcrA cell cycle regulator
MRQWVPDADTPAWPSDRVRRLIAHWNDGLSVAEIARRLGVSKSAANGKLQRLIKRKVIEGRPSPIIHSDKPKSPEKAPRAGKTTLPPLSSIA